MFVARHFDGRTRIERVGLSHQSRGDWCGGRHRKGGIVKKVRAYRVGVTLIALIALPRMAFAQADEIQVYDGGLAAVGIFNLTVHNNYTLSGLTTPAFPGAVTSNHAWVGVAEWAYGVTDWFEAGLYMPLYSNDETLGFTLNGFKLRTLFAVPHADTRRFFYGANFEFSYNGKHWDTRRFTSEIRPIVGLHLGRLDAIVNPILDTSWEGGPGNLEFVPATRIAYNVSDIFALALEEYADLGYLDGFLPSREQAHQIFAVVNYITPFVEIEFGAGLGLTDGSDNTTLKLILSRDLNRH
jgi:hypothetical protein